MNRREETIGNDAQQNESTEDKSAHPMDAFLEEEAYELNSPRRGEVRTGTIARITETDILVDVGFKSEGLIPSRELERLPADKREELVVGTEIMVYVLRSGGTDGTILLSIARAEEERDWLEAERLLKTKDVFEGVISGYNKGGLIVKLGRLRGFIPASQVSMARRWRADGDSAEQRWGEMVGEPIVSKVIEVERRRNRLILSERAAAREARDVLKERLIEELQPGEVRTGHVISLAEFGAFVDIGGADGLVHTSEISWKRIGHPRDILKVGQEVKVKVLGVDREQKRISLSLRELEEDPWDTIIKQYTEGQLVEGTVTKLTKFGAFASLKGMDDYELEGLVHISELSDRHIVHPREVVGESETLTLRIINVDKKRRRIGLSLKKVDSPEYAELDWQAAMVELHSSEDQEAESEDLGITVSPVVEGEKDVEAEQAMVEEVDEVLSTEGEIENAEVLDELEDSEEALSEEFEREETVLTVTEEETQEGEITEPEDASESSLADEKDVELEEARSGEEQITDDQLEPTVSPVTEEEKDVEADQAIVEEVDEVLSTEGEIENAEVLDELEDSGEALSEEFEREETVLTVTEEETQEGEITEPEDASESSLADEKDVELEVAGSGEEQIADDQLGPTEATLEVEGVVVEESIPQEDQDAPRDEEEEKPGSGK